jgi:hypothetical protein
MGRVPANLRVLVRERAGERCEYCGIHQKDDPAFLFHIEHIVARQHRGTTDEGNLALSCHHCNLHKGPNLTGIDPRSGDTVALFHPRTEQWSSHFAISEGRITGLTPTGRATVEVLSINDSARVELRRLVARSS